MTQSSMQHLAPDARRRADGLTLPRLVHRNAEEHGDLPAITSHDHTTSWRELRDDAAALSRAFHAHGLRRGDRMMIMMSSRLEHWSADLGAAHLGAVTCTLYRTSSAQQVACVVLSHRNVFYSGVLLEMLSPLPKHRAEIEQLYA